MLYLDGSIALLTDNEIVFSLKDNLSLGGIHKIGRDPHTIRYPYTRNQQTHSVKSQVVNILDYVSHAVSAATTQVFHFNVKVGIDNT